VTKSISLSTIIAMVLFSGCGSNSEVSTKIQTRVALGKLLFSDKDLSLNRTQSCATCHSPDNGFVDTRDNGIKSMVSLGDNGVSLGDRNAPSAGYASLSPSFHFDEVKGEYIGGQFWDGRAADLAKQAEGPPTNPGEMAMPDKRSVSNRLMEKSEYVTAFKTLYGDNVFDNSDIAYSSMSDAIAEFEKTDEFAPFDSKYDRYLKGEYTLSGQEELGMTLFFSQANTNCAKCHQLKSKSESANETFSNYEYHNTGVPKNSKLLLLNTTLGANFIDTGLLRNPAITDEKQKGKFKVPTLRNIAVTAPYMHNGVFSKLRTVLEFYDHFIPNSEHTINPETGLIWAEAEVNTTVNKDELTSAKVMSDAKIDAMIAFLKILTDAKYEHLLK